MNTDLLQAIAVTAELTGTTLSEPAARVMATDLDRYPLRQVLGALTRCRRELKGRLTIAEILTRLDDGRPGVEEAWSMIPKSEGGTVVWTEEMAHAFGIACPLLDEDPVAARMAFKESYTIAVQKARDAGIPAHWTPSLGLDAGGREGPLLEAVRLGRIRGDHAMRLLPYRGNPPPEVMKLLEASKDLVPA